jgi:hypothetical protein
MQYNSAHNAVSLVMPILLPNDDPTKVLENEHCVTASSFCPQKKRLGSATPTQTARQIQAIGRQA